MKTFKMLKKTIDKEKKKISKFASKNNFNEKIIIVKKINELFFKKPERKFRDTFENPNEKDFKKREVLKKFETFNKLKNIY
jgi:hypothetical protein